MDNRKDHLEQFLSPCRYRLKVEPKVEDIVKKHLIWDRVPHTPPRFEGTAGMVKKCSCRYFRPVGRGHPENQLDNHSPDLLRTCLFQGHFKDSPVRPCAGQGINQRQAFFLRDEGKQGRILPCAGHFPSPYQSLKKREDHQTTEHDHFPSDADQNSLPVAVHQAQY
jgi:hypothetical protein